MHVTLDLPGRGQRDFWAEDGATLEQVLQDLGLPETGLWDHPLDLPLIDGQRVNQKVSGTAGA
ncbi:MAG: hypothetical protein LBO75_01525, partial [Bifidobacteriaceae bacterium]|nr:hypothetical protein [Bifidobacteriaceae bacterium]